MEKKFLYAPHDLAVDLMDCFFTLYCCAAESMGADFDNAQDWAAVQEEGTAYARRTFCNVADEFEKMFPGVVWRWCREKEEEGPDGYPIVEE